jgi:hypothetical protein
MTSSARRLGKPLWNAALVGVAGTVVLLAGCGGRGDKPRSAELASKAKFHAESPPAPGTPAAAPAELAQAPMGPMGLQFVVQEGGKVGGEPQAKKAVPRKIKHTGDIKVITDEFDKAKDELEKLIPAHDGYEAFADVQSSPGQPRSGTWRVRVPVEQFAPFRGAVRALGEVVSDTVNTEDLTEQYYDLEANIKNLRAEQESWRDMLKKASDKVENLIAVKKELDRVTDDIQRKEGTLRLLANLTDLTTVNVQIRERERFIPVEGPKAVEEATFSMRAGKTFADSWGALRDFAQALAIVVVALTPWLPLLAIVTALFVAVYRRRARTVATSARQG